jgi:NAD(P)-dependent dehydrogenase (short-subunit alcohol dehydrogenase family)
MRLKPIKNQVVVLVGASSGIGRESALQFAKRGAKVVVAARNQSGLNSLVEEIRRAGGEAVAHVTDVKHFDQVQSLAQRAISEYGRIDTWVNLAAVSLYARFEQTTAEEFRQIIETNLLGQTYGAMSALPHLRRQHGGSLIFVTSVEAKRALPYQSAYAASKHGVHGMIESMRLEIEHDKIPVSVTEIMPASIDTPLFNKAKTKLGVKPKGLPPIYHPGIVSDAILYAAENRVRELHPGGMGRFFLMNERISPRINDMFLKRSAFTQQRTEEIKTETAPNNLFDPIDGYDRVQGDLTPQVKNTSISSWFETHPMAANLAASLALGTIGVILARSMTNGHTRT